MSLLYPLRQAINRTVCKVLGHSKYHTLHLVFCTRCQAPLMTRESYLRLLGKDE